MSKTGVRAVEPRYGGLGHAPSKKLFTFNMVFSTFKALLLLLHEQIYVNKFAIFLYKCTVIVHDNTCIHSDEIWFL